MATKDRLIASAVELIVEQGSVDRVSMRAIAKRAGVSPTAVYRHYADFDELISATVAWSWAEFDDAVNAAVSHVEDPHAKLQASGEAYLQFAEGRPGLYRVLFSIGDQASGLREEFAMPVFGKLVEKVGAVLKANADDRVPYEVATNVFAWIHGMADLHLTGLELQGTDLDGQVSSMMKTLRLTA